MKRLVLIVMLLLALPAWAQTQDSVRAESREIDGGQRQQDVSEGNVLGAPVYYDTLGNIRGTESDGVSRLPRHHYFNRLSNKYSNTFFEVLGMVGTGDIGIGLSFCYLPERWGGYGSLITGVRRDYFSFGPALRLSDYDDPLDWHLYGGFVVSRHLGCEVGIRMALPRRNSNFSWESASMGAVFVNGHGFITCGLSIEFAAMVSAAMLWW